METSLDAPLALALAIRLKQRYPHMSFLWEAVPCRYCNMPVGIPCQTRTGGSTSYPHSDRVGDFSWHVNNA